VLTILPYVPIATTVRVGIAVFSYCDQVIFGITADRGSTPDIDVLAAGIRDSLAELVEAAHTQGRRGSAGRRPRRRLKGAV
jgi:diacylglycerol O-acyltransferase